MKTTDKLLMAVLIACAILVIKLGIEMPDKSIINIILIGWLELMMVLSARFTSRWRTVQRGSAWSGIPTRLSTT